MAAREFLPPTIRGRFPRRAIASVDRAIAFWPLITQAGAIVKDNIAVAVLVAVEV